MICVLFVTTLFFYGQQLLNRHSDATLVAGIHKYFLLDKLNDYNLHNVFSTTLGDRCLLRDKGNECTGQFLQQLYPLPSVCVMLNISARRFSFLGAGWVQRVVLPRFGDHHTLP